MTNTAIQQNVMRRVRTIHLLQSVLTGATASVVLLVASLYFIGREVWVARVWQNMPSISNISAFTHFFTYAFLHTHVVVQALLLLTIFAALWLIREISKVFVTPQHSFI